MSLRKMIDEEELDDKQKKEEENEDQMIHPIDPIDDNDDVNKDPIEPEMKQFDLSTLLFSAIPYFSVVAYHYAFQNNSCHDAISGHYL